MSLTLDLESYPYSVLAIKLDRIRLKPAVAALALREGLRGELKRYRLVGLQVLERLGWDDSPGLSPTKITAVIIDTRPCSSKKETKMNITDRFRPTQRISPEVVEQVVNLRLELETEEDAARRTEIEAQIQALVEEDQKKSIFGAARNIALALGLGAAGGYLVAWLGQEDLDYDPDEVEESEDGDDIQD